MGFKSSIDYPHSSLFVKTSAAGKLEFFDPDDMLFPFFVLSSPTEQSECFVRAGHESMKKQPRLHWLLGTGPGPRVDRVGLGSEPESLCPRQARERVGRGDRQVHDRTRFSTPWVAYVPASDTVPSPSRYLGHVAGAEGELTGTAGIYVISASFAETSPRVRVQVIGRSEEGRDILLAAVADEEGIRDLDKLKARPRPWPTPEDVSRSGRNPHRRGPSDLLLQRGLHSTETGSPEMVMELAYRLAVSDSR